jgi:hypothetical protein
MYLEKPKRAIIWNKRWYILRLVSGSLGRRYFMNICVTPIINFCSNIYTVEVSYIHY